MLVKQISVFVENQPGKLVRLTRTLAENGIGIIAITISDTVDFGILRCIVDDPDKAYQVLKDGGFTTSMTRVLAVELEDTPGGMSRVLEYLSEGEIDVEYVYSFMRSHHSKALILFKVDDSEKALAILQEKGVRILCMEDILDD
ncbi:MAG: ACT domain-containing protein [Christensenellaceae bacterium]|nr:ACT domain-containing protein [Christensenellaceae bacterium]